MSISWVFGQLGVALKDGGEKCLNGKTEAILSQH